MNFDVEATHVFPLALFRTFLDGISDELGLEKIVRANTLEKKNLTGIWAFSDSIYGESAIQTHPNLHQLKELEPLNNLIVDVVYEVMKQHAIDPKYKVDITAMWGNVQPKGCVFHRHTHHNNIFGGVLYVNEINNLFSTERGKTFPHILFWNPRKNEQLNLTKDHNHPLNKYNTSAKIKKDLMVIFPAWLEHEVPMNVSSDDRVSIAFNIMLRGRYGEVSSKESTIF